MTRPFATQLRATPAGHAQLREAGLPVEVPHHVQHDLLADLLDGGGDVELPLAHPGLGLAGRAAEELVERPVRHAQPVVVGEVLHVELEGAVLLEVDHLLHDAVEVHGLPVGGEAHHLVLGAVDLEAEVVGEGAVEQPQAVREADLLEHRDVGAPADAEGGGGPLADAVHGEDRRLLEGGGQEARGGVAHVVLGEEDRPLVGLQLLADDRGHPQLLVEPDRHRLPEGVEGPREGGHVGREHPLELEQRLVVEADRVELLGLDARLVEHVLDRAVGEVRVVALAGEALLLAGGHHHPVLEQGGGGVVVEAGDPEDVGRRRPSELVPGGALGAEGVRLVGAPEGGLGGEARGRGGRGRGGA